MGAQPAGGELRAALAPRKSAPSTVDRSELALGPGASLGAVGETAAEAHIAVYELYRHSKSLEDVFLSLTGETEAGE